MYELSAAAYRSRWFCVLKQDGKTLRLVHDLQPLNAVTIQDSLVAPFVEHLAESFGRYVVYGIMDLFARYDQCPLHVDSRDMTTFNSPLGLHCLTTLPMGHTNAVQIYQADMTFILQDEIPRHEVHLCIDIRTNIKGNAGHTHHTSFVPRDKVVESHDRDIRVIGSRVVGIIVVPEGNYVEIPDNSLVNTVLDRE